MADTDNTVRFTLVGDFTWRLMDGDISIASGMTTADRQSAIISFRDLEKLTKTITEMRKARGGW